MAYEYAKVLKYKKLNFTVVGNRKSSCKAFNKKTGLEVVNGGVENFLLDNPTLPKYAIVCVNIDKLCEVTTKLIEFGVKKILCEKPGSLLLGELIKMNALSRLKKVNLYIAYNRRFYGSVIELKRKINKDNGLKSLHFDFTEKSIKIKNLKHSAFVKSRWLIANSLHIIDTAFYLAGMPKTINLSKIGKKLNWHPNSSIFVGSGITKRNILFSYNANWNVPGNWKMEFMTNNKRYILEPIEELYEKKAGLEKKIIKNKKNFDIMFKPGLYEMISSFNKGNYLNFCSIKDQIKLIKLCNRIAGY